MDKTTAGLLGAVAGLATMGAAHAETHPIPDPTEVLYASSYADLLAPVENAVATMKADDARRANVEQVQFYYAPPPPYYRYHHHHHHHHAYYHHHHHHHHHHHSAYVGVPGFGVVVR